MFVETYNGTEKIYTYENPYFTIFFEVIRNMDYSKKRRGLLLKYFRMGFSISTDNVSKNDTDFKKLLKSKKITLYKVYSSNYCKHTYYKIAHKGNYQCQKISKSHN